MHFFISIQITYFTIHDSFIWMSVNSSKYQLIQFPTQPIGSSHPNLFGHVTQNWFDQVTQFSGQVIQFSSQVTQISYCFKKKTGCCSIRFKYIYAQLNTQNDFIFKVLRSVKLFNIRARTKTIGVVNK